ncbi:hypothetical protein SAMN05421693_11461 [Ectothiorhodospira magna]|uniref:Transposase n=1 Tax=Ectothiorhodospira magna TaxID=867345 RepID=A0A1H9CPC2_9GAMM|nr:hypothetical protein SAMN05421693_11461 [Ectothiorhodospira magna]
MENTLSTGKAAKRLGVSVKTLVVFTLRPNCGSSSDGGMHLRVQRDWWPIAGSPQRRRSQTWLISAGCWKSLLWRGVWRTLSSMASKSFGKNINRRLASWTKGVIAEALDSVSSRRGSTVVLVNPAYTSQMDSRTGCLDGKRRGDQSISSPERAWFRAFHTAMAAGCNKPMAMAWLYLSTQTDTGGRDRAA